MRVYLAWSIGYTASVATVFVSVTGKIIFIYGFLLIYAHNAKVIIQRIARALAILKHVVIGRINLFICLDCNILRDRLLFNF
jgi:hypothetical protein